MSNETEVVNPATQTKGRARQEVSVIIQDELQIAGVTEDTFKALKEEAAALATLEPKSDADAAVLQKVITKGNNLKSTISDAIEPGKKWAHALHKAYTSNENEFLGTVDAIIAPLKAKKAAYKAEQERIEREALEAQERLIRARFTALEGFGFTRKTGIDGRDDFYTNGTTMLEMSQITMSEDAAWTNILKGIEMAWNEERERKETAERAEQEERDRLRFEQELMAAKELELERKQAAFNAKINEARKNEIMLIQPCAIIDGDSIILVDGYDAARSSNIGTVEALYAYSESEWGLILDKANMVANGNRVLAAKKEQERQREALIAERVKALKEAGWEQGGAGVGSIAAMNPATFGLYSMDSKAVTRTISQPLDTLTEEDMVVMVDMGQAELARRKKVEQERIAAEAVEAERKRQEEEATRRAAEEQERKAKLSDVERWDAWMVAIEESAPNLVSAQGQHAVSHLIAYIKDKYAPSVRNELKK